MLREALIIVTIAAAITLGLAATRGLPTLIRPTAEAATCSGPLPEHPSVRWISPADAERLLGQASVVFIDTRDGSAYEAGHVTGALHAPMDRGTLDERVLASIGGATTVIAYCDASGQCARSTRFASLLSATGFADVRVLEGGIDAWMESGRPAESGECRHCR